MGTRRLIWHLYPTYLLITLLALVAVTWYFSHALRQFYLDQSAADLRARAQLAADQVQELSNASGEPLQQLARRLGREGGARFTIILPGGEVAGDSAEEPARMENHARRPEVAAALAGHPGSAVRHSETVAQEMMYVAVPVGNPPTAVVRAALPLTAIHATLRQIYLRIAFGGLMVALLAALLSLLVSRRLSRPLEEMRRGAERFAEGDLEGRLAVGGAEEIAALAEAMNRMAGQLDERLRLVVRQRNEQEAVLASMVEGVLAVDTGERILRLNQAAATLFEVRPAEAEGRRLQEVIRKADLQRFVARVLASRQPVEGDVVLPAPAERFLQAHGTLLRDAQGEEIGALLVLNDVTRLRRLETLRRDFVANVSHELKTPITAIKGSAETLLDGALADAQAAGRFVAIIAKQADRLNAIINDLLTLSRLEQGGEGERLSLSVGPLRPVLEAAMQGCQHAADEKRIRINLFCSAELQARINPPLLEQAVINLLSNAVNYSEPGGTVAIEAVQFGDRVTIRVQDWGCGIEAEHLPRLFERFYRVDKARSRKVGGTGLGLAIVKHIVQAHGGQVTVRSTPGERSVFTLQLPVA